MNYDINKIYELPLLIQIIIIMIFSFIIIGIGHYLTISNLNGQIVEAKKNEEKLLGDYASIIDKQVTLKHHSLEMPQLKKILLSSANKFISESEYGDLVDQILKLGSINSVKFDLFAPGEKLKREKFVVVPIHIIMTGTYDHTARFMSAVANLSGTVKVGDFTMTNEAMNDSEGNSTLTELKIDTPLKTKLTLEVYQSAL